MTTGNRQKGLVFGLTVCAFLLAQMNLGNWILLVAWTALGMLIYIAYGYRHSLLRGR